MNEELKRYLVDSYRRDILHESVDVVQPRTSEDLLAAVKAELARIDALKLGANLATRDFVSYQSKRALERLLEELEIKGKLAATESGHDTMNFTGTKS
jgi:hypothetical protein